MSEKPSYEELELRVQELEREYSVHKQTTKDLLESEERFKALSNASFAGIVIHDHGVILDCNQGLSGITGFTNEELIGMNGLDLIAPDSLEEVLGNIKSGYDQRYEVEGLRRDGSIYPLAIKGKNIPYMGREARVIEFLDITDRKQADAEKKKLESRLQQAQKMEAIGTLAGGIAHDFNNILAVILGYAELAKDDSPAGSPLKNDIDQIYVAAIRAKELVKQILGFGRQTRATRQVLAVQPLIKEGLKMLRSSIPTTISITNDIDRDCGSILVDPTQFHQIMMNLCTNAYHAMELTGGTLAVSLKTLVIEVDDTKMASLVTPGEYVEFVVSDTGVGMAPALMEKIFDPYFTTKDVGRGTGMGLAIIHGIVKQGGGAVTVESQLGKGSSFHVFFPVVDQSAEPEVNQVQRMQRGTERILLVDDETLLCEMGQDILERLGYQVTTQCSSLAALDIFAASPDEFDLVLTDQTMPDMTGAELASRILAIRADIPIILCTGYSNLIDEQSAKAIGIREFVLKPLSNSVTGALVRKVLDEG